MIKQGRRERAKADRREVLLDAARRILATTDLSMRRLAEEAGLSEATPYNLFGSKGGVLVELYADQCRLMATRLATSGEDDPFARLLLAIDYLVSDLETAPRFFRALYSGISQGSEMASVPDGPEAGTAFWTNLVNDVADSGRFRVDVRIDLFARAFTSLLSGALLTWVGGRSDAAEFGDVARHGLVLMARSAFREDRASIPERREVRVF